MKRVWWMARIAVIVAASYCIFAPAGAFSLSNVRAEEEGGKCDTSTNCARDTNNNCNCASSDCKGCYVPSGSTGCGSCSSGPALGD